jgi:ABC-type uncharacterized transport system permease subunit
VFAKANHFPIGLFAKANHFPIGLFAKANKSTGKLLAFYMTNFFAISAILGYIAIAWLMFNRPDNDSEIRHHTSARPLWLFGLSIATAQCLGLSLNGSFNFFASLSWVSALMAGVASATLLRVGERFLPLLSFTVASLAIALHLLFAGAIKPADGWQIQVHASIALLAYAALSLASAQAVLLLIVERRLRKPRRLITVSPKLTATKDTLNMWQRLSAHLPPLSRLERQLFQLIGVGFLTLTLTLITGALFISNWSAQHLVHKTVLTVSAWIVFGTLLLGHWRFGWRGKQAAIVTLAGMGLLALAFFGSKFVLEVVLKRGI